MPDKNFFPLSRHGLLVNVCSQNVKSSDAALRNIAILGHSATKFVIYPGTEFYHCAAAAVSTSVGMDILGHSAKFPKLPRMKCFLRMSSRGCTLLGLMKHDTARISQHRTVQTSGKEGTGQPFGGNVQLQDFFFPHTREFCIGKNLELDAAHHAVCVSGV